MENKPIVEVQQVSMKFNLASEKYDSFKEYFIKTLNVGLCLLAQPNIQYGSMILFVLQISKTK